MQRLSFSLFTFVSFFALRMIPLTKAHGSKSQCKEAENQSLCEAATKQNAVNLVQTNAAKVVSQKSGSMSAALSGRFSQNQTANGRLSQNQSSKGAHRLEVQDVKKKPTSQRKAQSKSSDVTKEVSAAGGNDAHVIHRLHGSQVDWHRQMPIFFFEGRIGVWLHAVICLWLVCSYLVCSAIGVRFTWTSIQVLQVFRSLQCMLVSGLGVFTMGVIQGSGKKPMEDCSGNIFIPIIVMYMMWYFLFDLIVIIALRYWRKDLLAHHVVAVVGTLILIIFGDGCVPCCSASVAISELISWPSGLESLLPKPDERTKSEVSMFSLIRSFRLAVLIFIRPILWYHLRSSSSSSPVGSICFFIPGTCFQILDVYWAYQIAVSLYTQTKSKR